MREGGKKGRKEKELAFHISLENKDNETSPRTDEMC